METNSQQAQPPSLFHKAGTYSIWAIVASFVLQFFVVHMGGGISREADIIIRYIPAVVIISAIPAGIIALCGIPRYGFKKLLWKGVIGVSVPIALFILSVYVAQKLRESSREMMREIEEREEAEKKTAQPGATDNPDDAHRLREDH